MAKQTRETAGKPFNATVTVHAPIDIPAKATVAVVPESAVLYGIGPAELAADGAGRWLAYRVSGGKSYVLTPKRHGKDWGESKPSAVARVVDAMENEFPRLGRTR